MESIKELIPYLFGFFHRKNLKKYVFGELAPNNDELEKIEAFLNFFIEKYSDTNSYIGSLKLQIDQMKIPYLKELSTEELDFLIKKEIDFNDILSVIYAKGGSAKGLGSIKWNSAEKVYEIKKGAVRRANYVLLILVSIFSLIWASSFGLFYKIAGVTILPIVCSIVSIFLTPIMFLGENTEIEKNKLLETYPQIFKK